MEFKDRLKYLINNVKVKGKRITSYRIGKDTTISRSSFDNYISGSQVPSIEYATILANYFNVSVNWLLTGDGDIFKNNKENTETEVVEEVTEKKESPKVDIDKVLDILQKQADSLAYKDELLRKKDEQIQKMIDDMNMQTKKLNEKIFQSQLAVIGRNDRVRCGDEVVHLGVLPKNNNDEIENKIDRNIQQSK